MLKITWLSNQLGAFLASIIRVIFKWILSVTFQGKLFIFLGTYYYFNGSLLLTFHNFLRQKSRRLVVDVIKLFLDELWKI